MQNLLAMSSAFLVAIATVGFQVEGFPDEVEWKRHAYGHWWELGLPPLTSSELLEQQRLFSAVNNRNVWRTLCYDHKVDILDTLAQILAGFSRQPPNGEIDYLLGGIFLHELTKFAPQFLKDVHVVGSMINSEKRLLANDREIDYDFLFRHAKAKYYGFDRCDKLDHKFSVIVPLIHKAMAGDLGAAKEIIKWLAGFFPTELNDLGRIDRNKLINKILEEVEWYSNVEIKRRITEARKSEAKEAGTSEAK